MLVRGDTFSCASVGVPGQVPGDDRWVRRPRREPHDGRRLWLLLRRPGPLRMLRLVRLRLVRLRRLRRLRRCLGSEAERGKGEGELVCAISEEVTW